MRESLKEHPITPTALTDRELVNFAERQAYNEGLSKQWQLELIKRLRDKVINGIH